MFYKNVFRRPKTDLLRRLQISGLVLTMDTEINYAETLRTTLGAEYYNRLDRHATNASIEESKALTLHKLQAASRGAVCFLQSWLPGKHLKDPTQEIVSCPEAQLKFNIAGGVEIPHFALSLRLSYKNQPTAKNLEYINLEIKFMAWREDERDLVRRTTTSDYNFSDRLKSASVTKVTLTETQARKCEGTAGKEGVQVRWACKTAPYCYGRNLIGNQMMAKFTASQ